MVKETAFIHIDVDNLWAIADCYGFQIPEEQRNHVFSDALPRFAQLFSSMGIQATFFVLGKDLEVPENAKALEELARSGHAFANHSYSHRLDFRSLREKELDDEIGRTEQLIRDSVGQRPIGFRAPGYGVSAALIRVLQKRDYRYDSSVSPHPFGSAFRYLDGRLRRSAGADPISSKTQYPYMGEAFLPLSPFPIAPGNPLTKEATSNLLEVPSASSPLRLPFQAGVCMRLGNWYFDMQLASYRMARNTPLLFLFHGADLTDFSRLSASFFRGPFFSMSIEEKLAKTQRYLERILHFYHVITTEEFIAHSR